MLKLLSAILIVCALWIGFCGWWLHTSLAQAATVGITDQAQFFWDTPTVDTLGGPVTVTGSEFGVWAGTVVDPNTAPVPLRLTSAPASGATGTSALTAFAGLKGGTYTCSIRALTVSGTTTLKSTWSIPLTVTFARPAGAPTNLRLTVTITP